jgi:phage terminase large subunit-like protein
MMAKAPTKPRKAKPKKPAFTKTTRWTPDEIPTDWAELLRLIPGYDAIGTAEDAVFCPHLAQQALDFFPDCLVHVEGVMKGKPFILERWQQAIVANLFGWMRHNLEGRFVRRYRELFELVPRKNGKSPFAAGIALLVLFTDQMAGKQCYLAAGDREQAGVVFKHCRGMVEACAPLKHRCRIYGGTSSEQASRSIVREEEGSFLRVISSDADTKHGGITHLAIIDELHVQKNRDLVDVFDSSTSSLNVPETLLIYITTSDYERAGSICNEKHDYARKVRDGVIADPTFLPVLYEALPDEDWKDEEVWKRVNPNLGVSKSLEYMRAKCLKAQRDLAYQNTFLRLDLNIRTQSVSKAIDIAKWDACAEGVTDPMAWRREALQRLAGRPCGGGLDLGAVADLCAFALLFGDDTDGYDIIPYFWCPRDTADQRSRDDGVPYVAWANAGFLTLTDGDETDYQTIRHDINALRSDYDLCEIAADRLFQGAGLCQDLAKDGLNVKEHGQGYVSMAAPTRRFLELIGGKKLRHGANPILRWMALNAATEEDKGAGGTVLKFSKRKSSEKIDGLIAGCMAVTALAGSATANDWYTPGDLG